MGEPAEEDEESPLIASYHNYARISKIAKIDM